MSPYGYSQKKGAVVSGTFAWRRSFVLPILAALLMPVAGFAERETVLKQIDVPHNYYFREMYLPQLTNGPAQVAWSRDGKSLVYSMRGSLWLQSIDSDRAQQITAGPGYDYMPDWSPATDEIVFTRYINDALELHKLDLKTREVTQLTSGGDVNLEPRFAPDGKRIAFISTAGTGRFHLHVGEEKDEGFQASALFPERRSEIDRYYYSPYDHELSPSWSPDGTEIMYVSNPEKGYGTGAIWRRSVSGNSDPVLIRDEETTWKARPDWSPDGNRVAYSSYLGRQWHQLWVTTAAGGGDPLPLSYGDFDVTGIRWSPNGKQMAYIANEGGGLALWVQDVIDGRRFKVETNSRQYLVPVGTLNIISADMNGKPVPARISVIGADGRSYAPDASWMHADDGFDRSEAEFETRYFHSNGTATLVVPAGETQITVWRGLENRIARMTVDVDAGSEAKALVSVESLDLPPGWSERWVSGDVHVHMNYGGTYRNAPAHLVEQMQAEDLDVVYNLIVNKEQRVPDISYFSTEPDPLSNDEVLLSHSQEYHTSFWGHLGLLGLKSHFLLSDYSAYPNTAAASIYPDNVTVADLAHRQGALVGYVHPFDTAPDPAAAARLTNALPVDAALGKIDYYEVVGFSNHRVTADVWYRLLNLGFDISAAAGTDAMANYASLRGPIGMNRVYVATAAGNPAPAARRDRWQAALAAGNTLATNGPLLGFRLGNKEPGEHVKLAAGKHALSYEGFMRSIVPMDHLEIVVNGEVVDAIDLKDPTRADFSGTLRLDESSWVLVRAWNDESHPDVFDLFPYGTTNPVFVDIEGSDRWSKNDAQYFIDWIDRLRETVAAHPDYNTDEERETVLRTIDRARSIYAETR